MTPEYDRARADVRRAMADFDAASFDYEVEIRRTERPGHVGMCRKGRRGTPLRAAYLAEQTAAARLADAQFRLRA